ncbi:MAG TPA: hypothetical protein PKX92_11140, partial [Edaphocola sp.]|nr:hypothetical protein [Edaphocola sp.]
MKSYFYTLFFILCLTPHFSKAQIILSAHDTLLCKGNTVSVQAKLDSINWLGNIIHLPQPQIGNISPWTVNIGFPFIFFGDTFYIQQTGLYNYIFFKENIFPGYYTTYFDWLSFQNSYIGSRTVYLGAQDLVQDSFSIVAQTVGTPGNRKHIVYFCNLVQEGSHPPYPFVDCSGNKVTNYVLLYEGSNIIEIHTVNMPGSTVCPYPNNSSLTYSNSTGVQGLRYVKNNVVNEVFSPGRGPYDYWGHTGGQYTSRRFTPIPNYPFYQVDTIPFQNWDVIDQVDSNAFFWYDANGVLVGQGPVLNATATAPNGQDS